MENQVNGNEPSPPAGPVLSEGEKNAHANFMRASSSLGQIMVEKIQRSNGQINFVETLLLVQSLLINFDSLAEIVFEGNPAGREKFWLRAADLYDRSTSAHRQQLILSNGPKIKAP